MLVPRSRLGFGKEIKAEAGNLLPFTNIREQTDLQKKHP